MLKALFGRNKRAHQASATVSPAERIYAIGDIHGRADLLNQIVGRIDTDIARFDDARRPKLILMGDYIDRGDESARVLTIVMKLAKAGAICLLGNHEAALLDFLRDPVKGTAWLEFGGLQTLASYGVAIPDQRSAKSLHTAAEALASAMGPHLAFLRSDLSLSHQSGNVVFVHASLEPAIPLDKQDSEVLLWGSNAFLKEGWRPDCVVVHGHYAADTVKQRPGRICIDTGAYYTNRLTALRLDDTADLLQTGA